VKCPILTVAKVLKPDGSVRNDCMDMCAWFDHHQGQCAIISINTLLRDAESELDEIERNTRK
jgi:hypothetical protein